MRILITFHIEIPLHCARASRRSVAWLGLAWFGLTWLVWLGLAWLVLYNLFCHYLGVRILPSCMEFRCVSFLLDKYIKKQSKAHVQKGGPAWALIGLGWLGLVFLGLAWFGLA